MVLQLQLMKNQVEKDKVLSIELLVEQYQEQYQSAVFRLEGQSQVVGIQQYQEWEKFRC